MIEFIVFIVVVGAYFLGWTLGKEEGAKETAKFREKLITNAFSMESYDSKNIFHQTYGINGIYYSNVDPDFRVPLVIIQTADLGRYIAIKEVSQYHVDEEYLNEEIIENRRVELGKEYLLANGMGEDTIKWCEQLYK